MRQIGESAENIVLVAALASLTILASLLQKSQLDPTCINVSFAYKGGLKKEMDEICPIIPAQFQTYPPNLRTLRSGAVFCTKDRSS